MHMEDNTAATPSGREPPTLHHLFSSQSLRILWGLEELAAANSQPYSLKTYKRQKGTAPPELQSIFPLGASPILVIDPLPESPDQERIVVTESRLILQYLADNYSNGIWSPKNATDKRRNEYWQEFAGATLTPKVDFVMLFDILPPHVPWVIRPLVKAFCNTIANVYKDHLVRPFKLMEDALSEERPWFAGEKIGQADFLMSWPMDMAAQRGYFDTELYPKVAEWHQRVQKRPAYTRALEKGGSYNLVTFDF
jgi:glutathione S-transferase